MFSLLRSTIVAASLFAASLVHLPQKAAAHFLWIIPPSDGEHEFSLVFSEGLQPDDPAMLNRLKDTRVRIYDAKGNSKEVTVEFNGARLVGKIPDGFAAVALDCQQTWGMFSRGTSEFLLKYRAVCVLDPKQFDKVNLPQLPENGPCLRMELNADKFTLTGSFQSKPLAKEIVTVQGPTNGEVELDEAGVGTWKPEAIGAYGLRLKATEEVKGSWEGKDYAQVRYYTTVSVMLRGNEQANSQAGNAKPTFAELPQTVTSFGAARIGDSVFVYGGNTGSAHSYSNVGQMKDVLRLDLKRPNDAWTIVTESDRLQGLGMVAHGSKLIIAGGFNARNAEGEKQDLHSTDAVSVFDTQSGIWSKLPSLPEPRSSHDVAIIGDMVYVVGGWQLKSPEESHWHTTAWVMNLNDAMPSWKEIAKPPFERRALAALGHQNKLYVVGGMNRQGGPTLEVEVYDPKSNSWTDGPPIIGEKPMAGFGAAAVSVGDQLIVTNMEGAIQKLTEDGKSWQMVGKVEDGRFFHRLIPIDDHKMIAVGGASMESGKFSEVELIHVR